MDLFHEYRNGVIQGMERFINEICTADRFDGWTWEELWNELEQLIRLYTKDGGKDAFRRYYSKELSYYGLFGPSSETPNKIKLRICSPVPIRPTKAEKIWLKQILKDSRIVLFLSEEIVKMLEHRLEDIEDYDIEKRIVFAPNYLNRRPRPKLSHQFLENFKIVLQAIINRKWLRYSNHALTKDYIGMLGYPYKIEYSLERNQYKVSFFSMEEKRPVKADLDRIYDLSIENSVLKISLPDTITALVSERMMPDPLILEIQNINNAHERVAHAFSDHARKSRLITNSAGERILHIEIAYYTFQEENLFWRVVLFGPAVKIVGPAHLVNQMRQYLSQALQF